MEPILGGAIMISGNLTSQSAKDLAIILRSEQSDLTVESDDK
jgi:preprotein translocase subunit SecD